jgi:hypothetical protein
MYMMNKSLQVADIRLTGGQLVIDTTGVSMYGKHYNVEITDEGKGWIRVTAEKPQMGMSLNTGEFDVDKITDDSIIEYKPWPWSKTKKKKSKNIVEFKERTKRTYTSNNWQIIEE